MQHIPPQDIPIALKLNFVTQPLLVAAITTAKFSIGMFLLRLTVDQVYRRIIIWTIGGISHSFNPILGSHAWTSLYVGIHAICYFCEFVVFFFCTFSSALSQTRCEDQCSQRVASTNYMYSPHRHSPSSAATLRFCGTLRSKPSV